MRDQPNLTIVLTQDGALSAPLRERDPQLRQTLSNSCLLHAVALATNTEPDRWTLGKDNSNRPVVIGVDGDDHGIKLSLSHSGPFIVGVAGHFDHLGIDLEVIRERRFSAIGEFLGWPQLIVPNTLLTSNEFYFLWTLWEASIKATFGVDGYDYRQVFGELVQQVCTTPGLVGVGTEWACQSWENTANNSPGYQMTVVAQSAVTLEPSLFCIQATGAVSVEVLRLNVDTLQLDSNRNDMPIDSNR
jgi:hypothetical protein